MAMTAHAARLTASATSATTGTAGGAAHGAHSATGGTPCLDWLKPAIEVAAPACGTWTLTPPAAGDNWAPLPWVATRTPPVAPGAVRAARAFTDMTLRRWGAADLANDVGVVVSELLTNAFRHAVPRPARNSYRSPIRLGLLHPGSCVLCAVADPSDELPVLKDPDYLAETGRGLQVVASLSQQWGWTPPGQAGKVVWATFPVPVCA
jgi:Histidine kinase-like ATPase domain